MKKIIILVLFAITIYSCDDGDIVPTEIEFDDSLELCEIENGNQTTLLFFNTNEANEAIAVEFQMTQDVLAVNINPYKKARIDTSYVETIDGEDKVVFRKFNGEISNDYFCNVIPPSQPTINYELVSYTGRLDIDVSGFFDDNDGIPAEVEDPDNFDSSDWTTMIDTDGDGIPNIYDDDDDGDNVPTLQEGVVLNDDNTAIDEMNSFNTDSETGDTVLDYLDDDDDGDGVLTRDEDANGDLNPMNDNSDPNNPLEDDYLNAEIANETDINEYRVHNYAIINRILNIRLNNYEFIDENGDVVERINQSEELGNYTPASEIQNTYKPPFPND